MSIEAKLRRAGKGKRLVIANGAGAEGNAGLAAMIAEAFALRNHLLSGSDDSIEAMSGRLGMNKGRLASLIRLSHLAPEILGALLACRRPIELTHLTLVLLHMARRVERIARRVIGDNAGVMTDALWAGTFHGIGARLLRDYAGEIGLDPAFTIHDREDSADLMNLMRHELGFSKTENRFPTKGTRAVGRWVT